ncbi:MAG: DUF58 domain-containing protein [Oscillospiraceae bacterium]|nr:DUF58 domain-containing protein [Oscillospiraceae bacterium]
MFRVKLCYLLFLIGLIIFYVLYIDSLALVVLLASLVLPVLLKICLFWLKLKSSASLTCSVSSCNVNESIPVSILIENRCPLFFPKAYITVKIRHVFSDKSEIIKLKFPLHAKNTTRLTFYVKPDCCGAVQICLEKIKAFDYFYIFSTKIRKPNPMLELLVLPEKKYIPLLEEAEAVYAPESNQYANKAGDDPSEIFNIREYHAGDAVSRIHWKLSSKSEDILFVKEFGFPIEKQVLLAVEYLPQTVPDGIQRMKQAQAMLTLIYSIAFQLAEKNHIIFSLAWYDSKQDKLMIKRLASTQNLQVMFGELYHALEYMTCNAQGLRDGLFGQQFSSVTLVTNDITGELLHVLEQQVNANQKNLLVMTEESISQSSDWVNLQVIRPTELIENISRIII